MKKLLIFITLLLFCHPAFAVNVLGYPSSVGSRVTYERTNGTAYGNFFNTRTNRPWVHNNFDEGDYGQYDAMMYRNTGIITYAQQAAGRMGDALGVAAETTCNYDTGCNHIRDNLGRMVIYWSQICGGSNPGPFDTQTCSDLGGRIDSWASVVLHQTGNFGLVFWDSDELVGIYLGMMLYAAAIENDNPTRANAIKNGSALYPFGPSTIALGWLNNTGNSYRSILRNYTLSHFQGSTAATWFESSMYNLNTEYYLIYYTWVLNTHYGVDYFPEITSQYDKLANYLINQIGPNPYARFQWGDEQNPRSVRWNNLLPICMMLAKLTSNTTYAANLQYIVNLVFDGNNGRYWDPYGTFMDSTATRTAPSGVTSALASGLGTLFWHNGWSGTDTFFASQKGRETGAQHSPNRITSWTLFRNGDWAVRHPAIYNENIYLPYANGTMPLAGGFARWSEVWQEGLAEAGSNYAYHVGIAGGAFGNDQHVVTFSEDLHEFTNTTFEYHHADGSDTVIEFDRLNANFPSSVGNYYSAFQGGMSQYNSKHVYKINAENLPSCSGNRCSWNGGSETVYLDTFMPSKSFETPFYLSAGGSSSTGNCSSTQSQASDIPNWGTSGGSNCDTRYQARIIDEDRSTQHQVLINITHVGNNPTNSELTASSGELAKGVKAITGTGETMIYIGNAASRTSDLPTATNVGSGYNPNKYNQLKVLHWFKTTSTISFTTSSSTTPFFITDLNPSSMWTLKIDAAAPISITPSVQGVYHSTVSGTGTHTLIWNNTGAATPTCSTDPTLCLSQSTCESASYCWEDRGSGNTCYTSCSIVTPPAQCALDRPDLCTDQATCTAVTGLYWCNGSCSTDNSACVPFVGVRDPSCVFAYNFDQPNGHFIDQSLHGFDTQSEVGITYGQSGEFDHAAYFDEGSSLITIPENVAQRFSNGDTITITFWAKDAATINEAGQILTKRIENYNGSIAANYGVYRALSNRSLGFFYNNPSSGNPIQIWNSSANAFVADTWKYFMIKYTFGSQSSIHLYRGDDATSLQEISGSWILGNGASTVFAVPVNTTIGGLTGNTGETFKGYLDNLAVFNKGLTINEGDSLRQGGAPPVDDCSHGFLDQCTDEQGCNTAGGFFYNGVCNSIQQFRSFMQNIFCGKNVKIQ